VQRYYIRWIVFAQVMRLDATRADRSVRERAVEAERIPRRVIADVLSNLQGGFAEPDILERKSIREHTVRLLRIKILLT